MAWFLYLISISWIAMGSCIIVYTAESRSTINRVFFTLNPKLLAFLPAIVGVLLVFSASASHNPVIIRIFGALAMIKGAFIFINPDNLYSKSKTWYLEAISDQTHRLGGIIIVILGTAILSWVK